jgi:hypothetical protein
MRFKAGNKEFITWPSGTCHWYLNGLLHRDDGPAIIWADGTRYWYRNNKLHRDDGFFIAGRFVDGKYVDDK